MKITIEPTGAEETGLYRTVSISSHSNDMNITDLMDLVQDAIRALGYSEDAIKDYFK